MTVYPTKLPFSYPETLTPLPSNKTLAPDFSAVEIKFSTLTLDSLVMSGAISKFPLPGPIVNFLDLSTISGIHYWASPTITATEIAMHL